MRQIIIDFGQLRIYGYGLMLVIGFLSGIYLARWRARRMGEDPDAITYCGLMALVGGVIGARAAYIIQNWHDQFANQPSPLMAMLNISSGGLIYYGGLGLGLAMVLVYLLVKRLPARRMLDIIAPSLMLGLAFGRLGCLLNGCCFGAACSEGWPLATHFPMYSAPVVKLDRTPGPYSAGTEGPSPVYSHQWQVSHQSLAATKAGSVLQPDPRLLVQVSADPAIRGQPIPPRYLHGRLSSDQLAVMAGGEQQAQQLFTQAPTSFVTILVRTGEPTRSVRVMNERQFEAARAKGDGILRGSEVWQEAVTFWSGASDRGAPALQFDDLWKYLQTRASYLGARFDLGGPQHAQANAYLQEDLFHLASQQHSLAVKPSQALGAVNAFLLAALLLVFHRRRSREGQVFALMLITYPITRILEESIRGDNNHIAVLFGMTHNQVTSLITAIVGLLLLLALRRLPASAGPVWKQRLAACPKPR